MIIIFTYRFNKSKNNYIVYRDGKEYKHYGVGAFGKYAEKLAKLTCLDGCIYNNYYEIRRVKVIIKVYSKTYGYKNIIIDRCDFDLIKQYRWGIIFHGNNLFYATATINGKTVRMHRLIMNYYGNKPIDHKDRNGLHNRHKNLRITDNYQNNRNRIIKGKNTVWHNVTIDENLGKFKVSWREFDKRKYKNYSISKLGYDLAKHKAIIKSIKERFRNNYELFKDDIEYLITHNEL